MTDLLDGQVTIVTGGAGDVGRGVCRALTKAGATVVVLDIDITGAEGSARAIRCDVTHPSACSAAVEAVRQEFGGVHTLVNMAQDIVLGTALLQVTAEDMVRSFESGPTASLRMMQLCHPHLKAAGGGAIVNFASGAGTDGLPHHGAYAAAKEAIRGLTKVAAREWGRDNIRVNAVCPLAGRAERLPEGVQDVIPLGRIGDPEADIGAVVAFLAGPGGRYITGRTLQVDGGAGAWR